MSTIKFIPSYIERPMDGNNGLIRGDFVRVKDKKVEFIKAQLKTTPEAKIVPYTQQGLQRLQDKGWFLDVPVKPVLGETPYKLTLDENGLVVRMSYMYTEEQREKMKEARARKYIEVYGCDEDDGDDDELDSTSLLNLINA